jgi:hypothetical protein
MGKGDQADITSYRPLSVPTVACRVWSSLTNKELMDATEGVLLDTTFGFRPGFSCANPLFEGVCSGFHGLVRGLR